MFSPALSRAGTRPLVGLRPVTEHQAAGMRTDPAPSLPVASGTSPTETATAEPAEEPPGLQRGSCGLRVGPRSVWPQVCQLVPRPGTEVAPTAMQPART